MFEVGDYVSRVSYNNDTIFKIIDIKDDLYILKGVDIRLFADALENDLVKCEYKENDDEFLESISIRENMDRSEYFYLPGKILHIDTDNQVSNNPTNSYFIRENDNFKVYKKISIKAKKRQFFKNVLHSK